jgi:hypothetical protein
MMIASNPHSVETLAGCFLQRTVRTGRAGLCLSGRAGIPELAQSNPESRDIIQESPCVNSIEASALARSEGVQTTGSVRCGVSR